MTEIREILHRRTDLSTFVVHLTRRQGDSTALDVLASIASTRQLEARTAWGWAKEHDDDLNPRRQSQRVVCFSETPLEHVYSMTGHIARRSFELEPYGLALTKLMARKMGINPIWYVDKTPGQTDSWKIALSLDQLLQDALMTETVHGVSFHEQALAAIFPYFEQMGTWPNRQKEFWWEREWRHAGPVPLPESGVIWLCPEGEISQLHERAGRFLSPWIDPCWGLEQIVAHLAGFRPEQVSPFVTP